MGELILEFQGGGKMDDEQKRFTAFLVHVLEPTSQEDFEQKINSLTDDDLKELYKQFKIKDEGIDQALYAKAGAKLQYLKRLKK